MATTPTYEAATSMAIAGAWDTPSHEIRRRIVGLSAAVDRAQQVHAQTIHSSRIMTAVSFFVTAAIAVGAQGALAAPMFGFLAVALFSAASSQPLARHRFQSEIEAVARASNLTAEEARGVATDMFAECFAAPNIGTKQSTLQQSTESAQ